MQEVQRLLRLNGAARPDMIEAAFRHAGGGDSLNRMLAVDAETQLPDDLLMLTDKMSMATSLECRVPLLDHELVELAARMPEEVKIRGGRLKHAMKEAVSDLLPRDILERKKRGFGTPMGAWLKEDLAPLVRGLLSESVVEGRGLFHFPAVQELIAVARGQSHRWYRPAAGAAQPGDLVAPVPGRPHAGGRDGRAERQCWRDDHLEDPSHATDKCRQDQDQVQTLLSHR